MRRRTCTGKPRQHAPDDRFYKVMDLMREMGDRLEDIEARARDPQVISLLETEAEKWHMFQSAVEHNFLTPERMDL